MTKSKSPDVLSDLTEEEACLFAIFSDPSGIDPMEFCTLDEANDQIKPEEGRDGTYTFRCWPIQQVWWRDESKRSIDQGSRSVGKSMSIRARCLAFPFVHPGSEMVITAPEGVHLEAVTEVVETLFTNNEIPVEMLVNGRSGFGHKPFIGRFKNGAKIKGLIPQRDGRGLKGSHPLWLEMDESCFPGDTLVLTKEGYKRIDAIEIGDEVLTHLNNWKRVLNVFDRGERDTIVVRGQGHPGIEVTPNHRFWAEPVLDWNDRKNKWGPKVIGEPQWVRAENLDECFWSSPTSTPIIPFDPIIPGACTGPNQAPYNILNDDFMWILGLYLAEGSTSSSTGTGGKKNKVTWSIHTDEVPEVMRRLKAAEIHCFSQPVQNSENAKNVVTGRVELAQWISQFGNDCYSKMMPGWVHSLSNNHRESLLAGLVYGDGSPDKDERYAPGRWKLTTTSKTLAYDTRLLAQSVGYSVTISYEPGGREHSIRGRGFISGPSYQVVGSRSWQGHIGGNLLYTRTKKILPGKRKVVYDIEVEDDHSFIAEGIVVHNSDYPEAGWKEIIETLKQGNEDAQWRAHGVTRGMQDSFYKYTQPDSGWKVHHLPAMFRPTWTSEERDEKIQLYGSSDSPDYRRNILGLHGDATSPLFVLHRLLQVVDDKRDKDNNLSEYNTLDYYQTKIDEGKVRQNHDDINGLLEIPISHRENWSSFWIGMDIGRTIDPSVVVVFAEERKTKSAEPILRLLSKLVLTRVGYVDQMKLIVHLCDYYKPHAYTLDSTGAGQPILEIMQEAARNRDPLAESALSVIKGYNFSSIITVDFDDTLEDDGTPAQQRASAEKAQIRRPVKDHATDQLRLLIDKQRLILPYDKELISEFQMQSVVANKGKQDEYGRGRSYAKVYDHTLDACRMAILGWKQHPIEVYLEEQKDTFVPVQPIFLFD